MSLTARVAALDAKGKDEHEIATELGVPVRIVLQNLERIEGAFDAEKVIRHLAEKEMSKPAAERKIREKKSRQPRKSRSTGPRKVAECGTLSGYTRHYRQNEKPCQSCLDAHNTYQSERKRKAAEAQGRVIVPRGELAPCGTNAAARRHERAGEPMCDPCKEARRAHRSAKRAEKPKTPKALPECGTHGGITRHKRLKEPLCDKCREFRRAYDADYLARKRAAS